MNIWGSFEIFTCLFPFANTHGLFFKLRCTWKYCSEQEWRINWAPDIILKMCQAVPAEHAPVNLSPNHAMLPWHSEKDKV